MNTLASTLAHELNQPLTAAKNYLVGSRRLVEDIEAEEAEVVSAAMQGAERQILLAANIIRRIREMVADQGCAYEETSLSEIVNRSDEHTSELQSLMRISYADFCLIKQK